MWRRLYKTPLFCNTSSDSLHPSSIYFSTHLVWKDLPVFRVGEWSVFPENAGVAQQAFVDLGSRACECLSHLFNLDRQHWGTSNPHDSQKCPRASGHLFMLHQIFSPSGIVSVTQWGWLSVLKGPELVKELSPGHVLVSGLQQVHMTYGWFIGLAFLLGDGIVKCLKLYHSPRSLHCMASGMDGVSPDWKAY